MAGEAGSLEEAMALGDWYSFRGQWAMALASYGRDARILSRPDRQASLAYAAWYAGDNEQARKSLKAVLDSDEVQGEERLLYEMIKRALANN